MSHDGMASFRHLLLVFLIVTGLVGETSADTLKPELQAVLLLKVLAFDTALDSQPSKTLRIGVLSDASSEKRAKVMTRAFSEGGRILSIRGKKVRAFQVGLDELSKADVVYIDSAFPNADVAAKKANVSGIAVLCGSKSLLGKGGSIAVVAEKGKPRIFISRSGVKKTMSLDSKLVHLAKLVP